MSNLKLCKKCKQNNEPVMHGYIGWLKDECYECPVCKGQLEDTILTIDEYKIIDNISDDVSFLEAMIKLKQDDIIEYQSRMSQFKLQQEQKDEIEEKQQENQVHCPYCNSTNVKKITGTERAVSVGMLGLFSKKLNKSFKCKNCGGTF